MTYALNYSFYFRYHPDEIFSVNIPFEKLVGVEMSEEKIRNLIDDDPDLLLAMLGHDELRVYESMLMAGDIYRKNLERFEEVLRVVKLDENETPAE